MNELQAKKDIEKISYDILKSSKSLGVFPTPVDKIVEYSELIIAKNIDISTIHTSYLSKATDTLKRALGKVRGLLVRKEKTIVLDLSQLPQRINFVKLHEVGHDVLPWQQSLYDALGDDDDTLNPYVKDEFEAEANFFASTTLFQGDRFITEADKLGLDIDSSLHLSKYFGASVHATLRRYVEYSKKRCALIVLEGITPKGMVPIQCNLRDFFPSNKFIETYGELNLPLEFGYTWEFTKYYYYRQRYKRDGAITLLTQNGNIDFSFQFFYNQYNAFVFMYPKGEKQSTKTKFIVTQ